MKDDAISRQAVLKLLSAMPPEEAMTKAMLSQSVKQMDAAQPEIIRCRDCKHWREDHTCREHSLVSPMMAYEFCSRAERREE